MDCQKAMNLLSLYVDGSLTGKNDDRAIQEHLSACKACSSEYDLQKRLSGTMNSFNQYEIQAPPDLCTNIMGQIRQERKRVYWFPTAWRKTIAAVASILLIAGMSLGITGNLVNMANKGSEPKISTHSPQVATNNESEVTNQNKPSQSSVDQQNDTEQQLADKDTSSNSTDVPPKKAAIDSVQESSTVSSDTGEIPSKTTKITATNEQKPVAATVKPSDTAKPVLLSSKMRVTSTTLKVSVNDPNESRIKAVAMAAGAGASTQLFPEQNGSKKIMLMRLTVASEQTPQLISELTGLGIVVDRYDENRDITSSYNEKSVQYAELQSKIEATTETEERRQLENQAAGLRKTMDSLQAEASKKVILLWLEEK